MPMDLKKKLGPLPTWAWLALLLAVVGYLYWKHRNAGIGGGNLTEDVLTTGVLPQGVSQTGAPPPNSSPASSLSSDVLDSLSSQFADVNTQLAGIQSNQQDIVTALGDQLQELANRQNDLAAAVSSPVAPNQVDTVGTASAAVAATTLSPPAVTAPLQFNNPAAMVAHVAGLVGAEPKPTTNVARPPKVVTVTKPPATAPKPSPSTIYAQTAGKYRTEGGK